MTLDLAIIGSRGFPSTYGGFETLVQYLARHLVAEGHRTTVYCRTRSEPSRVWYEEGVRCVTTPGVDTNSLSTLSFGLTSAIDAAIRRPDAALVLNVANGYWGPILRAARVPFVMNPDGIEWERAKWNAAGRTAFKAAAQIAAKTTPALVCDSQAIARLWEERFGRTSTFIPYGAEIVNDHDADLLHSIEVPTSGFVLVVARLAPENNVELTLDALEEMGDHAPPAVIVGRASFPAPLESRLQRMDAIGTVRWLGHVDDARLLNQLWRHCGVYVHGHSVGGTNPSLLQALGAGAPTLALDTVYNREVLVDDRQLYRLDRAELATRIAHVLASPGLQDAMRSHGQAVVRARYSWPDVCQRYAEVLASIARPRRGTRRARVGSPR